MSAPSWSRTFLAAWFRCSQSASSAAAAASASGTLYFSRFSAVGR
ncbi:hypothetical protein N798_12345 [Knoellia flava TL1]|uniref:Uncharacterized protein n=1 Tax=Knoellia flava TL1 TaxID=1385518 RepID=A0ABR4XBW1_9MICO|nr:hypothetical protein N798_12345 [Knoellia flava TL1]